MELKLESCLPGGLRKAIDSGFAIEAVLPVMELVIRVHQCRHGGRRIRASLQRWTNQGNGYFRGHVRINRRKLDEKLGKTGRKVATDFTQRLY
jgi:hypothetical protein